MPTATADRGWRLLVAVPVAAALVLGLAAAVRARSPGAAAAADAPGTAGGASGAEAAAEPLAVQATSTYDFHDLGELVDASDMVVRGRVVATSRGRAVGEPGSAVVSRVVTVEVSEVLAGASPRAGAPAPVGPSTVLVEEEGWLADGTPIEVNGVEPSREGLDAVWFLDALPPDELSGYLVINHQGRYVVDGTSLHGATVDDPLVRRLEAFGPDGLATEVRRVASAG